MWLSHFTGSAVSAGIPGSVPVLAVICICFWTGDGTHGPPEFGILNCRLEDWREPNCRLEDKVSYTAAGIHSSGVWDSFLWRWVRGCCLTETRPRPLTPVLPMTLPTAGHVAPNCTPGHPPLRKKSGLAEHLPLLWRGQASLLQLSAWRLGSRCQLHQKWVWCFSFYHVERGSQT